MVGSEFLAILDIAVRAPVIAEAVDETDLESDGRGGEAESEDGEEGDKGEADDEGCAIPRHCHSSPAVGRDGTENPPRVGQIKRRESRLP